MGAGNVWGIKGKEITMKCNAKIKTIVQYKCLQYLENWGLSVNELYVELIKDNAVKVTDRTGKSMVIEITPNGKILEDGIPAEVAHA